MPGESAPATSNAARTGAWQGGLVLFHATRVEGQVLVSTIRWFGVTRLWSVTRFSVVPSPESDYSRWQLRAQPLKEIYSICTWTDAFLIYMAIYVDRFPAEVLQMLKYMHLIRSMTASRHWHFLNYDRAFRKPRASSAMSWDVLRGPFSVESQAAAPKKKKSTNTSVPNA